jgi:hypothetical protein
MPSFKPSLHDLHILVETREYLSSSASDLFKRTENIVNLERLFEAIFRTKKMGTEYWLLFSV